MAIEQTAARYAPTILSILRIAVALLFLAHGTGKMFGFPSANAAATAPALFSMYWFAASIEIVGSILMVLGLFTRPVAFIIAGETAVVYWLAHFPRGGFFPMFNGGEAAIMFCFVFLYICFAGPGAWSLDGLFGRRER